MRIMISSKLTERINELCNVIKKNRSIFPDYVEIYVFGSFLTKDYPNDIDILVIYDDFDHGVTERLDKLMRLVESVSNYPADVTALTRDEIKEIKFLDRLNQNFIKVI